MSETEDPGMHRPHVAMLGGNHTFVQDWAKAARATGADVTLFSHSRGAASVGVESMSTGGITRLSLAHRPRRPSRLWRPANEHAVRTTFERALKGLGEGGRPVSDVHTHFYAGNAGLARLVAGRGLTLTHTEHSSSILNGTVSKAGVRTLREVCENASTVFAVGEHLAQRMADYGVSQEIKVVPNPVDTSLFGVTSAPDASGGDAPWRFVTVGWLVEGKNHRTMLQAFAKVVEDQPRCQLDVIGDGPLLQELIGLTSGLGIDSQVRFLGRRSRSQVADVLMQSHCYVHASTSETFGVALVEAWSSGLPVVAFACGGVSEETEQIGGILVEGWSSTSLAVAMRSAMEHGPDWDRVGIRRLATARFDYRTITDHLAVAYRGWS